jgi:hypothetical protein
MFIAVRSVVLAFTSTMLVSGAAFADVSVEQRMTVTGAGVMSMANMTGTSTTTISGDRARTDSELRFESAMVRALAHGVGGQTVEIVDLDQDRIYAVNPKKKTYTESSFTEKRAQLQQAMQAAQQGQAKQAQGASGVDESKCEWLPAKSDLKRTGEKNTIAGYTAEHVVITASQACRERDSGQVCEFALTLDQWMAADFKSSAEALKYQQAYAEKLGLTASSSRDFSERAQTLFSGYEGIWKQIAAKMKDVKGYSVKASFSLGVGGAQCESAQKGQAASGSGERPGVGGALMKGALGGLGGLFGKKKKDDAPSSTAPSAAPGPNGIYNLMTIGTELVSVKTDAAPAGTFEVPAGFKKVSAD